MLLFSGEEEFCIKEDWRAKEENTRFNRFDEENKKNQVNQTKGIVTHSSTSSALLKIRLFVCLPPPSHHALRVCPNPKIPAVLPQLGGSRVGLVIAVAMTRTCRCWGPCHRVLFACTLARLRDTSLVCGLMAFRKQKRQSFHDWRGKPNRLSLLLCDIGIRVCYYIPRKDEERKRIDMTFNTVPSHA